MRKNYRRKIFGRRGGAVNIYGGPLGVTVSMVGHSAKFDAYEARNLANSLLKAAECIDEVPRVIVPPSKVM